MVKEEKVVSYYVFCNKLKEVVRTGWINWNLDKERLESIAEHVYGVLCLAIAMYSNYKDDYDLDFNKVLLMLTIHETEEIFIGDLTQFEISKEEKAKMGHVAVHQIFNNILNAKDLESLVLEFDERKTNEAKFAYFCDKLECDIQSKIYDEEGCIRYNTDGSIDMNYQIDNPVLKSDLVNDLLNDGDSFSQMWIDFGQKRYDYDKNFLSVSNYARNNTLLYNNKINKGKKKLLIDVDDVICLNVFLPLVNEFLGTSYKLDDFSDYFIDEVAIPKEKFDEFNRFISKKNKYKNAVLLPYAYDTVKKLNDVYDVYILSSCINPFDIETSGNGFLDKYNFLIDKLPFLDPNHFIFTSSKDLVDGDIIIDDRLDNLKRKKGLKILFPAYHNKNMSDDELKKNGVIRAGYDYNDGWINIYNILLNGYKNKDIKTYIKR